MFQKMLMSLVDSVKMELLLALLTVVVIAGLSTSTSLQAADMKRYYAHEAVTDKYGVIAPWYKGHNGQFDMRIRIAAETLRRYPWLDKSKGEAKVPEYLLSSFWNISPEGVITTPPLDDWMNGDRGQLASYVLYLMPEYYRYSGDPMAIAHAKLEADLFLKYALTPADHPWPNFPISVPMKGKPYGQCDPKGFMQLDLAARVGYGMLHTYQLTGDKRYLDAVKHWADVLAEKRNKTQGVCPWNRYANFELTEIPWKNNKMTGGVIWILFMFDDLIRLGYTGKDNSIVEARDAARAYLRDVLLPAWTVDDTWGRQYWDWECPIQVPNITAFVARYMMDHKDYFPNWKNDCRNIMSLCINNTCASRASNGDIYNGAWATPESRGCCGRCLTAGPQLLGTAWARYASEAESDWAKELVRRQMILMTYEFQLTGVSEDNIDGGVITNGAWFEAAQLAPLKVILGVMSWLPDVFGPGRENHIMRSSSIVDRVTYGKGEIDYTTFDAPKNTIDVLRLAFKPINVTADGKSLESSAKLDKNGYSIKTLANGDCIVTIRHDDAKRVTVEGDDPQQVQDSNKLSLTGNWTEQSAPGDYLGSVKVSGEKSAEVSFSFTGNQVRIIGRADTSGGLADVYLDGTKLLAGIDCWSPIPVYQQMLFIKNGLSNTKHEIRIVARGEGNPISEGSNIYIDAIQWSDSSGENGFGEGSGPTSFQRLVFGYPKRDDYVDSKGSKWWPGCEVVARTGEAMDAVRASWWTEPAKEEISGTEDPELYRYGVHWKEFAVKLTVGPGSYHARLKFAATRDLPDDGGITIAINGKTLVEKMNVEATAGGRNKAVDLVFNDLTPLNGIIEIMLKGGNVDKDGNPTSEAFIQAIEIGPGNGGTGATPQTIKQ